MREKRTEPCSSQVWSRDGRGAGRTDTLSVVGQPLSSMGPLSGSSREYSTEKATGFT